MRDPLPEVADLLALEASLVVEVLDLADLADLYGPPVVEP